MAIICTIVCVAISVPFICISDTFPPTCCAFYCMSCPWCGRCTAVLAYSPCVSYPLCTRHPFACTFKATLRICVSRREYFAQALNRRGIIRALSRMYTVANYGLPPDHLSRRRVFSTLLDFLAGPLDYVPPLNLPHQRHSVELWTRLTRVLLGLKPPNRRSGYAEVSQRPIKRCPRLPHVC